MSSLHMLTFGLWNSCTFTLDPDGPFPTLFRLLTVRSPSIHTLDLSKFANQTILITGSTSGCGLECAMALGRVGCRLILTTRSRERGENVMRLIQDESKAAGADTVVNMLEMDMTSFRSIELLPSRLKELGVLQIDIAILNAGVYHPEFLICPETGWEETLQVNMLATSALTKLLRPYLARAENGRLLVVSSEAHAWANPQQNSTADLLTQINKAGNTLYPSYQRYHLTKLLLILWTQVISHREEWEGVSVASVSPGYTQTSIFRDFNDSRISRVLESIICRSAEQGASQYMYALQDLTRGHGNGGFWSDGRWRSPSRAMTRDSGQGIQRTIYMDIMGILRKAGVIEEVE
ncbi:hypothetical protein BGZ61DRAFT_588438 [Ilyonectria robusta]|uniref:uncharacterized protein n=1 Tax=Ilyonectria robusta TaxID=1079257 RepID=UPI001E8D89BD|nr:uncharacterized protein BGZ61DRAFT_588438 [Ilyonectria robusta]KAH8694464.1 hypothetical protein BGZ61DRAFT_588438 [Ilyonectria robusta]